MNNKYVKDRNEKLAQKIIKGLKERNMTGYYARSKEEALKVALENIPKGSTVTMGGAYSVHEIGLVQALKEGDYSFIDRNDYKERRIPELLAYDTDVYLSGSNAITEDGILVNIDRNSNRVSAIAYGPKRVIIIIGFNKICSDIDSAIKRARNVAAPINANRIGGNTPCVLTGSCVNCKSIDTICCNILITRYSTYSDRIHVILVNDNLGF